ncbi:MAG: hypothetical protein JO058_06310 [Alphaproteobacteria bacterium]|nr:hypothetical protein [Alphaproteobacteria bacterium]MBV9152627.1 hypothetical protein [Alphaproteobacteria bacterium]
MATIATAPTPANVFVYRCVPNAPTAQNGEKFGAMPPPFKMSGATAGTYRVKCKKSAE